MEFTPMRSVIYLNLSSEEYRHKLLHWLYYYHVPESIEQFQPYVTKYAFYQAFPVPPDGNRFGSYNFQLTEHHWLVNPMDAKLKVKTYNETFFPEVGKWQSMIMDKQEENKSADEIRASLGAPGSPIFTFLPMWWEQDLKGSTRTIHDGPNYRWQFLIRYPESISEEEGDKWLFEKVIPHFVHREEVTRILSSKVIRKINNSSYYRAVEMWFDAPSGWHKAAVETTNEIERPAWATADVFPYLLPMSEIAGIFLGDLPTSDNLVQYRGYIPTR